MTTDTKEITNTEDVIDVREITERVEYLMEALNGRSEDELDADWQNEQQELIVLSELLEELRGNGGDHDWRGDWYPITLVRDSYFEDFAREEAVQLGYVTDDLRWPFTCIDWEKATEQLQADYSTVEFGDVTYWYR